MQKSLAYLLSILFVVAGCVQTTETTGDDTMKPTSRYTWYDSLVKKYIDNNKTSAEILAANMDGFELEWRYEGMVETDSVQYMTIRIGHSDNNRFITDDWVYIDSAKRRLFEFDTETDSIKPWPSY